MQSESICKLDAARRQLETAVDLFFENGDPVSIHTLACAAYDVIDYVNHNRGGQDVFCKRRYTTKSGNLSRADLNTAQNFFKHADKDPEATLEFFPVMTEALMADACRAYMEMTGESIGLFHCFIWWFKCAEGTAGFDFPSEKQGLLESLIDLYKKGDRCGFLLRCAAC